MTHTPPFRSRYGTLVLVLLLFGCVAGTCRNTGSASKNTAGNPLPARCFKARLEIKGLCMNYVIKVLDGDTRALQLSPTWTDETDNKTYTNVFALGSRCTFPEMAEGAEFYFTLAPDTAGCNVCMAYRPVPPVKNSIAVQQTPCN